MNTCEICGKTLQIKFTQHLEKVHSLDRKVYYDTYLKKDGEGICKYCGEEAKFLDKRHGYGYREFCDRSCAFAYTHLQIKNDPVRREQWAESSAETMRELWANPHLRSNRWGIPRGNKFEKGSVVFRSSWELRFSNQLDELNIPHLFEPEAFLINTGSYYTPDFYLPDFDLYVEISPDVFVDYHIPKIEGLRELGKTIDLLTESNWDNYVFSLSEKARSLKCGK